MHYHFNKEKQILIEKGITNLIPISEKQVNELLEKNKDTPFEYIIFLKEIGCGNINNILDLKGFLFDFNDLGLEDIYNIPENIKLFGDNFSGDFIGFDFNKNGEIIEFLHESGEIYWTSKNFKEYIIDMINNL
jgi:hypothetical protein